MTLLNDVTRALGAGEAESGWARGQPLKLEGVRFRRGGSEILRGVDVTFDPGRRYVIVGPSGSGKSTLLRLLNRLDEPSAGRLWLGRTPLVRFPVREIRQEVGLVFQAPRPLPGTLRDNLIYPSRVRSRAPAPDSELRESLTEIGLDPAWLDRDAADLSGGERQRLALAVALQVGPEILVLDEPTSALDPAAARRVMDVLQARSRSLGLRTIAVTHQRGHALRLGDTAVVLAEGRVTDQGPAAEVLSRADAGLFEGGSAAPEVAPG